MIYSSEPIHTSHGFAASSRSWALRREKKQINSNEDDKNNFVITLFWLASIELHYSLVDAYLLGIFQSLVCRSCLSIQLRQHSDKSQ